MLSKEEYVKTVRRDYLPLYQSLLFGGFSNPDNFKSFVNQKFSLRNMIKSEDLIIYYSRKELLLAGKLIFKEWKNKKRFEKTKKLFIKREKALVKSTKKDFRSFCNAYEEYMPSVAFIFAVDNLIDNELRGLLQRKISSRKADKIMDILNIPLKDNFYKQEEHDLVKINSLKGLKRHVKKYEWVHSRYGDETPYTLSEAKKGLLEIDKDKYLKKRYEEKTRIKNTVVEAKKIIGKRNEHFVDIMQFIVYYRTHRTDVMNMVSYLAIPLVKKQSKKYGLTYKEFLHCIKTEVLWNVPDKKTLKERMKGYTVLMEDGFIRCIIGSESRRIKNFLEEDVDYVKELKGVVASKGRVVGKAKVILSKKDFNKLKHGDILITSMTTPDMVPIMKKASAFLTDEGGTTCHAAIIAREMRKPCIIGTKIATKIFKNGDMVEVDANKGVVKKIN